jgi:LEA14-like dessication related protein
MSILKRALLALPLLLLFGCGSLTPGFEQPQVNITSFTLAPNSTGVAPRFNIGIRVVNPNRIALPLRGMSYSVEIEGNRILNGATPNLPTVPAYDTADFVIEASPDLLGSVRLLSDLFSRQRTSLGYTFTARIDTAGMLPSINVEESGNFGLPASRR